jgi:hypothetical protein
MSKAARKVVTRQVVEETLQRIANDQQVYYQAWMADWANLIADRARGSSPKRKKSPFADDNLSAPAS